MRASLLEIFKPIDDGMDVATPTGSKVFYDFMNDENEF